MHVLPNTKTHTHTHTHTHTNTRTNTHTPTPPPPPPLPSPPKATTTTGSFKKFQEADLDSSHAASQYMGRQCSGKDESRAVAANHVHHLARSHDIAAHVAKGLACNVNTILASISTQIGYAQSPQKDICFLYDFLYVFTELGICHMIMIKYQ